MGFFTAEDLIIARLEAAFDDEIRIKTASDMAGIEEGRQALPAIYVVYSGFEPTRQIGQGALQEVEHSFYVVVAIENRKDAAFGRRKAEWMVDVAISALSGARLNSDHQPLLLKSAPQPVYTEGFAYFPLAFATRAHYRGSRSGEGTNVT